MRNTISQVISIVIFGFSLSACEIIDNFNNHLRSGPSRVANLVSNPVPVSEDVHVQAEVYQIELNSTYYRRTGLKLNPDFFIDYENHPFDVGRSLSSTLTYNMSNASKFQPIRITFVTDKLDSQTDSSNSDKVDYIKNTILPKMGKLWGSALNVVPVKSNLYLDSGELAGGKYCGDSEFSTVPSSHMIGGAGIPSTDLVLYVSATASTRFCGSSTLAVALACNFDQYDRPIAGNINFCLGQIEVSSNEDVIASSVMVAAHEAGHVLGMSSNSFRYFRDPTTGKPRTARPFSYTSQTCWNGQIQTLQFPSNNTVQFTIDADTGDRYALIVTPTVQAVVRNQFNCQSLKGARLEHWPTNPSSCIGDHWDERQFNAEVMSPVISPTVNYVSPLTLALLEDSGWYVPNYNVSKVSPWGLGAGCDFEDKPCLDKSSGTTVVPDYGKGFFCTKATQRGCSPDRFYKMACTAFDYANYQSSDNPAPPTAYQYFTSSTTFGGPRLGDYCPVFSSSYAGVSAPKLDCRFTENQPAFSLYNEKYGADSQCFESNLGEAKCFEAHCVYADFLLKFYVGPDLYECKSDFEEIQINLAGISTPMKITCPRLSQACPDMFCPANCAGRGVCNYSYSVNGTVRPRCECFNANDTSIGCSESVTLDGKYFPDALTSKPKTVSWAWAVSLFVVFLLLLLCIISSCCCRRRKRKPSRRGRRSDDY